MIYDSVSIRSLISHTILLGLGRGLRRRPLLTLLLIGFAAFACLLAIAAVTVAALAAVVVAGVALIAYNAASLAFRPRRSSRSDSRLRDAGPPAEKLRRYLSAVDEFGRLTELAMSQPLDRRSPRRQLRRMIEDARQLGSAARTMSHSWRGNEAIVACIWELCAATDSLIEFLQELGRYDSASPSNATLRWKRDDLARRRDRLTDHLRSTDFRTAAEPSRV